MTTSTLTIPELLMLLALDDDNGRVRWNVSPYLDYALAGGLLAELALRKDIRTTREVNLTLNRPANDLELDREEHTGWALLDEVQARFRDSEHPHTVAGWVTAVSAMPELSTRIMEELVAKDVLEHKEGHFLWLFHTSRYPTKDSTPEHQLIRQIREAIIDGKQTDHRLAVLIAIAHGAHLLKGPLTDEELEKHKDRIAQISRGDTISTATCELISEAERALYVASSIPFMAIGRF